jgi:uncharacterized lipoprotein YmbA
MSEKPSNTEKLLELLGGKDPAKRPAVSEDVLKEALEEIEKKRKAQAKEKALEILGRAMELRQQAYKAEQEFNKQKKKFDDELGKLLNQLRAGVEQATQPLAEQLEQVEKSE